MNDLPYVSDRSDAVFNRVIVIPMNRVVPEEKRDLQLDVKLSYELAGIFNWALRGGERLRRNGYFTRSEQSKRAREEYKQDNDAEGLYISERLERAEDAWIVVDALYQDYKAWCSENGYYPKQKRRVGRDWKRLGLTADYTPDKKYRIWKGARLVTR